MSIYDYNFINCMTKLENAIERVKYFEPSDGYYLAFSGGKDSIVCYSLLKEAGVKFDSHYNNTNVDPPDLIYFIRENYSNIEIHNPKMTMWQLIEKKKMPPTRKVRYCCQELKEGGGEGRFVVTGVRWAESSSRSARKAVEYDAYGSKSKDSINKREKFYMMNDNAEKRNMIERCEIKGKHILNPIIDWTDAEVWEYIQKFEIKYCKLYDEGWNRIGCVGCPIAGPRKRAFEFECYPKIKSNYIRAFDRMIKARNADEMETLWKTGEEVMQWWITDKTNKMSETNGQLKFVDL